MNGQLQLLKALELMIRVTCPAGHRTLIRVYNRVGPVVARRIRSQLAADAVYLLLKPLEWTAWVVVRLVAKVPCETLQRVYRVEEGER